MHTHRFDGPPLSSSSRTRFFECFKAISMLSTTQRTSCIISSHSLGSALALVTAPSQNERAMSTVLNPLGPPFCVLPQVSPSEMVREKAPEAVMRPAGCKDAHHSLNDLT